jgi:hypothetical protein
VQYREALTQGRMQITGTLMIRVRIASEAWPQLGGRQRVAMVLWVVGLNDLAERVMRL